MNIFLLHIFLSNHFGITTTKMQSIHKMKNTKTQNLLSKISATVSSISEDILLVSLPNYFVSFNL